METTPLDVSTLFYHQVEALQVLPPASPPPNTIISMKLPRSGWPGHSPQGFKPVCRVRVHAGKGMRGEQAPLASEYLRC